jgi:hypothetical protein
MPPGRGDPRDHEVARSATAQVGRGSTPTRAGSGVLKDVTPCSLVELYRNLSFLLSRLLYFSALETETLRHSETSVNFHQTTRRHIAGDGTPSHLHLYK